MGPRISIVTLGVSDLSRSVRFYRDGLWLPLSEDLAAESLSVIGSMAGERELSDHFGVGAVLTSRRTGHG